MKKVFVLALAILALLLPLRAQTVESNLVDAVSLYSNGQYAKAQRILQTLSVASPESDAVWYYLAQTQLRLNDMQGAEASLEKAVALDSTNFWYRRTLARLYLAQGNKADGKALYESLVKDFPENQSLPYELLEVYLTEKDFDKALGALEEIEHQRGMSEEVATTRHDIYQAMGRPDLAVEALEAAKEEREATRALLDEKEEELRGEVENVCRYVAGLESSPDSYASLAAEREAAEKELLRAIEAAAAETDRLRPVSSTGTYIWPSADSRLVTRGFGGWTHPEFGVYRVSYGIDVAAGYGTSVMAVDGGVVVTAEYSSVYGDYVVLTHGNGLRTLYAHLSHLYVSPGDTVTQGSVVGLVGASGLVSEPYLHFEVIRSGAKVDPLGYYTNYQLAE